MITGSLRTIESAAFTPDEVVDLIPVRPIGDGEAAIRELYRTKLGGLYGKLTE
jgi:pyrroline-5-carboxylate reductase